MALETADQEIDMKVSSTDVICRFVGEEGAEKNV